MKINKYLDQNFIKAYCTQDAAQKDLADGALIEGLKKLKPELKKNWADEGCSSLKLPDAKTAAASTLTEQEQSCLKLKSQMVYGDAAIAAFTAKRALYKKNITSVADAKKKLEAAKAKAKDSATDSGTVTPFRP